MSRQVKLQFKKSKLSQAIGLACFALAINPVYAATNCGTEQSPDTFVVGNGTHLTNTCVLEDDESLTVETNASISVSDFEGNAVRSSNQDDLGDIINNGTLTTGDNYSAIYLSDVTSNGDIVNTGTINADNAGIHLWDTEIAGEIRNSGTIFADEEGILGEDGTEIGQDVHNTSTGIIIAGEDGIAYYDSNIMGEVINDGTIMSGDDGIALGGSEVGDVTNNGTIVSGLSSDYGAGIALYESEAEEIHNGESGEILADGDGIGVYYGSNVGNITNDGFIFGEDDGIDVWESDAGDITNNGTIAAYYSGIMVGEDSSVGDIVNNGTISTGFTNYSAGVAVLNGEADSITNTGTISSSAGIVVYAGEDFTATVNNDVVNDGHISVDEAGILLMADAGYDYGPGGGVEAGRVEVNGDVINSGTILSGEDGIELLAWAHGEDDESAAGSVDVTGDILNEGFINVGEDGISLSAYAVTSNADYGEDSSSAGEIDIWGDINNTGTILANDYDYGSSHDGISIFADAAAGEDSSAYARVDVHGDILNSGTIIAGEEGISLYAAAAYNSDYSTTWAEGEIDIGGDIHNSGIIDAYGDGIRLETGEDFVYGGQIDVGGDIINSGTIYSDGSDGIALITRGEDGNIDVSGDILNSGLIDTDSDGIYINGNVDVRDIVNSGDILVRDNGIEVSGEDGARATFRDIINTETGVIEAVNDGIWAEEIYVSGDLENRGFIGGEDDGIDLGYDAIIDGDIINSGTIISLGEDSFHSNDLALEIGEDAGDIAPTAYSGEDTYIGGQIINSGVMIGGVDISNGDYGLMFENSGLLDTRMRDSWMDGEFTQTSEGVFKLTAMGEDPEEFGRLGVGEDVYMAADTTIAVNVPMYDLYGDIGEDGRLDNVIYSDNGDIYNLDTDFYLGEDHDLNVIDNDLPTMFTADVYDDNIDLIIESTGLTTANDAVDSQGATGLGGIADAADDNLNEDTELGFFIGSANSEEEVVERLRSIAPSNEMAALAAINMSQSFANTIRNNTAAGASSGDDYQGERSMWIKPFGAWTTQDDVDGIAGYEADTYGIAGGIEYDINENTSLGLAIAYATSDLEADLSGSDKHQVDSDAVMIGLYSETQLSDVSRINAEIGYGQSDVTSHRVNMLGTANASYDVTQYYAGIEYEYDTVVDDDKTITPYATLNYFAAENDAYTEKGTGTLWSIDESTQETLVIGGGVKMAFNTSENVKFLTDFGLGYDLMADSDNTNATAAGGMISGIDYTIDGIDQGEIVYNMNLGFEYAPSDGNATVTAEYELNGRENYMDHILSLKGEWKF